MSYTLETLRGKNGVASNTSPLVYEFSASASEAMLIHCQVKISAVSAGVNVGNPAILSLTNSWDNGTTWENIASTVAEDISAAGVFTITTSATTWVVAPLIRLTVTPPAGETVTVEYARKCRFPYGSVPVAPPAGSGVGSNVNIFGENFVTSADRKIAVSPAGGVLSSNWPYVAWDKVEATWTVGTFTEVFEYFNGAVSVGTVTIVYTDATKEQLVSVTYSSDVRS